MDLTPSLQRPQVPSQSPCGAQIYLTATATVRSAAPRLQMLILPADDMHDPPTPQNSSPLLQITPAQPPKPLQFGAVRLTKQSTCSRHAVSVYN